MSYRTVPFGAVEWYRASAGIRKRRTLRGLLRLMHTIRFRLPSGKRADLSFTVVANREQANAFRSSLNEHLTATKSLFAR
jgi:hypothetical protein